jgi:Ca2+-binding EF-hand superfamily protein
MSSKVFAAALVLAMGVTQTVAAQGRGQARGRGQNREQATRFPGLDQNNDGRITRAEWKGSDQSFRVHDWNGDGMLSGDEVRPGARRDRQSREVDLDDAGREYEYDDWTVRGFTGLDHNRDNRITADEWHFDREGFRRADHNRDGAISRGEFLNEDTQDQDDDRDLRFANLDVNKDNRVTRDEWYGTRANFDILDDNRDGVLTRVEVFGTEPPSDLFTSVDVNRNGMISRDEWHWSLGSFTHLDRNQDGRLTREEFSGTVPVGTSGARSQAYQMGYERGLVEGRAAGRQDRERNQGWDLEGQRELEGADSGFNTSMGPKADYQTGYRAAFRVAYREGYGPR